MLADIFEPAVGGLPGRIFQAFSFGPARQSGNDFLADANLLAEQRDIFLRRLIQRGVIGQFAGDQRHSGEWRAEFVGGASGERAHRHHSFVTQSLLAGGGQFGIALADQACHADDEPGNHHRRDGEGQPHTDQVQSRCTGGIRHRQGDVINHQQRVKRDRRTAYR